MNLAVSVVTPEAGAEAPLALLAGTFAERLEKAAAYGFSGIELVTVDPERLDADLVSALLKRNRLRPASVATGFIAGHRGLTLIAADREAREAAARLLEQLIRLAGLLGTRIVTIGSFRGKAAAAGGREAAEEQLACALHGAEQLALDEGVTLALEPINPKEWDFLNTAEETVRFLDQGGFRAANLLLDSYHLHLGETDPVRPIRRYRDRLAHFHLADTQRLPVGSGEVDFKGMETALRETGYCGWQSLELARADAPDGNALRSAEYLRKI